MNMRDPAIYRIKYAEHHRQGNKWCICPMYDFAHPIQDAIEGITTACAVWSSRTTARCTTGSSRTSFGAEFPQREFAWPEHD